MNIKIKTVGWTFMLLILGVLGWQWYQRHFPNWDEEVQLSDGRMIIVHRAHKFNTENALIETALTFDLPEMGGKQTWREFLYPAIVDVYEGKVYVVGDVRGSLAQFGAYRAPRLLYVAYVFSNGAWQRIPFLDVPNPIRQTENVPGCLTGASHTTWQSKQAGWCAKSGMWEISASRYVSIQEKEIFAKKMLRIGNGTSNAKFGSE